jgi:hypothetical protein
METITLINGNKQAHEVELPRLLWQTDGINDVALAHVRENTGLDFVKCFSGYEAKPASSQQIAALFLTYNFKTRYYNNASTKNTLILRGDHHTGFDVSSICFDCVKHNHLHVGNLKPGDRLAC